MPGRRPDDRPRFQAGLRRYAAACHGRVGPGTLDVPDACAVFPEAWELVERGHVTADDFKAFTHDNALALFGDEMFADTVISSPMTARWQTGTVECGGEEIYYEVSGDDDLPAIMLTHGAGGTHAAWFQQVPTLAANGFRVDHVGLPRLRQLDVDLRRVGSAAACRRHGRSSRCDGHTGAHLVGQSMGGWW